MNDANLRRRITGLERQLDGAWRLYVVAILWMTAGAAFFVCGAVLAALGWGFL